jgi:U2AF family protein (UHM) kinase 1
MLFPVSHFSELEHNGRKCLVQQLLDTNVRQTSAGSLSLHVMRKLFGDLIRSVALSSLLISMSPYDLISFFFLRGLYILHSAGFVHADLKPDNLLWSAQDGYLKIIDFSLSFHNEDIVRLEFRFIPWISSM